MTVVYEKNCVDCRESNYGICEKHFEDFNECCRVSDEYEGGRQGKDQCQNVLAVVHP